MSDANLRGANLRGAFLRGAFLSEIKFNEEPIWPDATEVAKAKNIPEALKKQLGIPTDGPQENDGSPELS